MTDEMLEFIEANRRVFKYVPKCILETAKDKNDLELIYNDFRHYVDTKSTDNITPVEESSKSKPYYVFHDKHTGRMWVSDMRCTKGSVQDYIESCPNPKYTQKIEEYSKEEDALAFCELEKECNEARGSLSDSLLNTFEAVRCILPKTASLYDVIQAMLYYSYTWEKKFGPLLDNDDELEEALENSKWLRTLNSKALPEGERTTINESHLKNVCAKIDNATDMEETELLEKVLCLLEEEDGYRSDERLTVEKLSKMPESLLDSCDIGSIKEQASHNI